MKTMMLSNCKLGVYVGLVAIMVWMGTHSG